MTMIPQRITHKETGTRHGRRATISKILGGEGLITKTERVQRVQMRQFLDSEPFSLLQVFPWPLLSLGVSEILDHSLDEATLFNTPFNHVCGTCSTVFGKFAMSKPWLKQITRY